MDVKWKYLKNIFLDCGCTTKEEVEKLNSADALIFTTEKQLKEYGEKIPADKKAPIEEGLTKLKAAYAAKNLSDIEVAQNELNTAWTAASEEMYKGSEGGAPGQPGAEDPNATHAQDHSDSVTDVDFEEVKDDNK